MHVAVIDDPACCFARFGLASHRALYGIVGCSQSDVRQFCGAARGFSAPYWCLRFAGIVSKVANDVHVRRVCLHIHVFELYEALCDHTIDGRLVEDDLRRDNKERSITF